MFTTGQGLRIALMATSSAGKGRRCEIVNATMVKGKVAVR